MAKQYVVELLSASGAVIGTHGPLGLKAARSYAQKEADARGATLRLRPIQSNPSAFKKKLSAAHKEETKALAQDLRAGKPSRKALAAVRAMTDLEYSPRGIAAVRDRELRSESARLARELGIDRDTDRQFWEEQQRMDILGRRAKYAKRLGVHPAKLGKAKMNPSGFPMSASPDADGARPYRPRETRYIVIEDVEVSDVHGDSAAFKRGEILSPQKAFDNHWIRYLKSAGAVERDSIRAKVLIKDTLRPVTSTRHGENDPGRAPKKKPRASSLDFQGEVREATRAMNVWGYEGRGDLSSKPRVTRKAKDGTIRPASVIAVREDVLDVYRPMREIDRHSLNRAKEGIKKRLKARGEAGFELTPGLAPLPRANPKRSAYQSFVAEKMPEMRAEGKSFSEAISEIAKMWRDR